MENLKDKSDMDRLFSSNIVPFFSWKQWFVVILCAVGVGIGTGILVKYTELWALLVIPAFLILAGAIIFPEIGLPVFVFIIYTNLSANLITFFDLPSIAKPAVGLLSFVVFIRTVFLGEGVKGLKTPIILLMGYIAAGGITLVYVENFDAAYESLIENVKIAYYSVLIVMFTQKKSVLRNVVWALLFAGTVMGAFSMFQNITGTLDNNYWGFGQTISSDTGTGYRVAGVLGDPNYYAMIMAVLMPIAFDRVWNEKNIILKFMAGLSLFLSLFAVMYTYSRGGFLALMVGLVLMAFYYKLKLTPALIGILFFIILYQFLPKDYSERLLTLSYFFPQDAKQQLIDKSIQERTSQNLAAWEMFKDYPLTGVGMSNYKNYYYYYARPLGLDTSIGSRNPHNLYFQILAERGLLGLFVFVYVMYKTFHGLYFSQKIFLERNQEDLARIAHSFMICLVIYLVASMFLHDSYIRYYWVLIGIAWSFPVLAGIEDKSEDESLNLQDNYALTNK